VFVAGLALFTSSSIACALAPTAALLIAARAVQGVGAAMVMPISLTILAAAFPPERRGAIVGIWGGVGGLAVAAGPLVGGAITQGVNWHWIFWVNAPIGLAAILLSVLRLPESKGPATRLDLPAAILVGGGAVAVVWGLIKTGDDGWTSPTALGTVAVGVLLIAAFVLWEARAADPMLPVGLFRNRSFAAGNITAFLMSGTIFSAAFLVSQFMQFGLGYSPLDTGLRLLPWTATPLIVAPAAGLISDRVGRQPVMVLGMLLQGVGLGWFALLSNTGVEYGQQVLPLVVAGIGISMALPVVPTVIVSSVEPRDMGKASGVNSTLQRFGSAFAIAVAAAVFAANGHIGSAASFAAGFRPALELVAGLSLLGALSGLAVQSRPTTVVPGEQKVMEAA